MSRKKTPTTEAEDNVEDDIIENPIDQEPDESFAEHAKYEAQAIEDEASHLEESAQVEVDKEHEAKGPTFEPATGKTEPPDVKPSEPPPAQPEVKQPVGSMPGFAGKEVVNKDGKTEPFQTYRSTPVPSDDERVVPAEPASEGNETVYGELKLPYYLFHML